MSLKSFLSSLLPHFERSRVIEDIDSLATDNRDNLVPAYSNAAGHFRGGKFASTVGKQVEGMFHLRFPQERQTNHVSFIAATLSNTANVLQGVEAIVLELFARDVTKDSLTYKKAALLQYLSLVRFAQDYAGRYLLRLLTAEAAAGKSTGLAPVGSSASGADEDEGLLPIDKRYFQENLETFLQALHVLSITPAQFAERLGQMQDLQIVVDKINTIQATLGPENVDPLKLGFIAPSATNSPIYKLRSAIAGWQVANHNRNKELAKALQLRLYALKDASHGKTDPRLQQQIEYNEARLKRLQEDMANFEERYGS